MPESPAHSTTPASEQRIFQRLDTCAAFPYSMSEYARRAAWELVQATLIRWSPRRAEGWRRMWLRIFGARITPTSSIKRSTRIKHPWLLTMGRHCTLAEEVEVYNLGPVEIGDHSVVSQRAYVCAGSHDYTRPSLPLLRPTIRIGSGVWVCAGAYLGPGACVGDNSIVGACAVVTRDVPPGVIVGGNPARVIRPRPMPGITAPA